MKNLFNIIYDPNQTWPKIAESEFTIPQLYTRFIIWMAAIPPVAAYIGTVYSGWQVGIGEPVRLTTKSALLLSSMAYLAILVGVYILGRFVHWIAKTYGSEVTLNRALALVAYSGAPLFLVSICSVYPVLWLNTLFTLVGAAMAIRILFVGTPIMMGVNDEKGILLANSILTVGMVMLVGVMVISVLFWGFGFGPVYQ